MDITQNTKIMPYIDVIVDEMSDLMLVSGKDIENYIQKLSNGRAAAFTSSWPHKDRV